MSTLYHVMGIREYLMFANLLIVNVAIRILIDTRNLRYVSSSTIYGFNILTYMYMIM